MKYKGIILGGAIERADTSETRNQAPGLSTPEPPETWHSIKRSAGAHRIATHLREEGWDIEVVDFWPAWTRDELLDLMEKRVDENTKFIGISSMFPLQGPSGGTMVQTMNETVQEIKKRHPHLIIIGGSQNVGASLQWWCDYYIAGFAEVGIIELLKYITGDGPEPSGMVTKEVWGMERKWINCRHHYPAFPWPDAKVKYEDRDFMRSDEVPTVEFSRGCKFKCRFCSFSVLGVKGDYSRDEDSLYEELLDNYERWGITTYSVSDETINDSEEKLAKLARIAKRLPFQPSFQGFMRADLLASKPDTWQDVWDSGVRSHLYGVETLNHEAGKFVGKGMNPDRLKEGLLRVQDYFGNKGFFRCTISTIIGLPGETEETFLAGRDWILNNFKGHAFSFFPLFIGQNETFTMMTNPSVLEREWADKTTKVLWETNAEEMGVDYEELHPRMRQTAKFYMEAPGVAKWANKDMNVWQAFKIFNRVASEALLPTQLAPGIFFYHRYLTGTDHTVQDMQQTFLSEDKLQLNRQLTMDDYNIDPSLTTIYPKQYEIIEEYKRKKLAV